MAWQEHLHVLTVGRLGARVAHALAACANIAGTRHISRSSDLTRDMVKTAFQEADDNAIVLLIGPSMMHGACERIDHEARQSGRRWGALVPENDVLRIGPFLGGDQPVRYGDFLQSRRHQTTLVWSADAYSFDHPDAAEPGMTDSQIDRLVALWLRAAAERSYPHARIWTASRSELELRSAALMPAAFPRGPRSDAEVCR